jgi:hypothetical protein
MMNLSDNLRLDAPEMKRDNATEEGKKKMK